MGDKPTYDELGAHVERLREVVISCGQYVDDYHNRDIMVKAVQETPSQSLNHIKAQVEEETIEVITQKIRSKRDSSPYDAVRDALEYIVELIEIMPRKYKEQSNED